MISLVIPCYNPPGGWEHDVIRGYTEMSEKVSEPIEVIVVNDGSPNILQESLTRLKESIPRFQYVSYTINRGKGHALRQGVRQASGKIIIYTDIDFPYTSDSLQSVYKSLISGSDVAIGIKDKNYYAQIPFLRRRISKSLRKFIRFFLSLPVTDTQCGLKGFKAVHKEIFLNTTINRYLFDLEFVHNSYKHLPSLIVSPVEIQLKPGVIFRSMNYKILFTESYNFLRVLLKRK